MFDAVKANALSIEDDTQPRAANAITCFIDLLFRRIDVDWEISLIMTGASFNFYS